MIYDTASFSTRAPAAAIFYAYPFRAPFFMRSLVGTL